MKKLGLVGLWLGKISCLVIGGVYLVFQVFLFAVYFLKVFKLYLSKFDIANLRYCMLFSSSSNIEIWVFLHLDNNISLFLLLYVFPLNT